MSPKSVPEYWTTIDNVTYDLTNFIEEHPGGSDMVMLAVGRDATIMYNSYHRRLTAANELLKKLPTLPKPPKPSLTTTQNNKEQTIMNKITDEQLNDPVYAEIRTRVNDYFIQTKQKSRGGMIMKSLFLLAISAMLYYIAVVKGYFLVGPLFGISIAVIGLAIQHDANHGAFHANKYINRLAGTFDDIIGGSALMWRHQHDIAHHAYPNDEHEDADTYSNYPLLRLNPSLPLQPYMQFQHIYVLFLYCFLGIQYPLGDIASYITGTYAHIRLQPFRLWDHTQFWIGKVLHYTIVLGLPVYYHGWFWGFFGLFLPLEMIGSFYLASLFAVSHNAESAEYNVSRDCKWAEMQIRTSCNWSVTDPFWLYMAGGLNFQIEHHLFPGVAHRHYPAISLIVQDVCKKHNIPYNAYPTYTEIFISHLRNLRKLGTQKNPDLGLGFVKQEQHTSNTNKSSNKKKGAVAPI